MLPPLDCSAAKPGTVGGGRSAAYFAARRHGWVDDFPGKLEAAYFIKTSYTRLLKSGASS